MNEKHLIHIVDDDDAVRSSLERLMASVGYLTKSFSSAVDYLEQFSEVPSCLILDLRMPQMSGVELQQQLLETCPGISIVFLTGFGSISTSVKAIQSGAVDFIEKPFDEHQLLESVNHGVSLYEKISKQHHELNELQQRMTRLTDREKEVFALVVSGLPNKLTADALDISEKTVKIHRARVMEKMQADSLPSLVRMADLLEISPQV